MADFFRMTITFKNNCDEDKTETLFYYLSTLYKNGQILNDYQLIKKDNAYFALLTVPDKEALDPRFNSIYTNKYLNDIETKLDYLGENIGISECCRCSEPSWYMLYADYASNESPIVLGNFWLFCLGDIKNNIPVFLRPSLTLCKFPFHFLITANLGHLIVFL